MTAAYMLPRDLQRATEHLYSKKNVRGNVQKEMESSEEMVALLHHGVELLQNWMSQSYYESKEHRLDHLRSLDEDELYEIVIRTVSTVLLTEGVQSFTSVVGQLAGQLGYSETIDGVKTAAEVLSVLAELDTYDIDKPSRNDSLIISSNYSMEDRLRNYLDQVKFLPPMVCEPNALGTNYDTGYLTQSGSLILGKGNAHDGNICLDSLNLFNSVPLSLDVEFLKHMEEEPKDFDTPSSKAKFLAKNPGKSWPEELRKRHEHWMRYKHHSYQVYLDLVKQGNKFWLTHAPDKRGRTYARGYHISTQGSEFRKAIVDFHDAEPVRGVPAEYLI
jgi:hypothetical protein